MREGQSQPFLRKLRNNSLFSDDEYNSIYPNGSQPARIYCLPKMRKFSVIDINSSFRPIVSSIGTYNYNLAKYLGVLLSPSASTFSCQDSFTFVKEVKEVRFLNKFMVLPQTHFLF